MSSGSPSNFPVFIPGPLCQVPGQAWAGGADFKPDTGTQPSATAVGAGRQGGQGTACTGAPSPAPWPPRRPPLGPAPMNGCRIPGLACFPAGTRCRGSRKQHPHPPPHASTPGGSLSFLLGHLPIQHPFWGFSHSDKTLGATTSWPLPASPDKPMEPECETISPHSGSPSHVQALRSVAPSLSAHPSSAR